MFRSILLLGLLVVCVQSYETQQIQMPEASALLDQDEDLASQVKELQRNVTELWTYIHTLRNAVTQHLNHLRQHQVELESMCHQHCQGGTHASHTDDHSHSGEHHSHSGEHHSHSGEHQHSHSGEHQHSHSGEHQHSHSGEHHSHTSGGGDHHDSHSHTSEDSHSSHAEGGHHHGDSHESEDLHQSQQPTTEPLILPSVRQPHTHHHHAHGSSPASASSASSSTFKPMQLMTEQGHHHHHHHHHAPQPVVRNLTRTAPVVLPKYSEYALYDFAVCNVQPNRAIPEEQQQNVMGQVTLFQKKLGGPLNIHVRLQGFATGGHHGAHQALQSVQGPMSQVQQDPMAEEEEEHEEASQAAPGHRHGFHIHTNGDLSNGCQSTGPHFNPKGVNHGGPKALVRHVGDLGNIECDDHGIANLVFSDPVASLRGQYSIIGKSMVIHSGQDDYGLGGDEESLRTGNAGTRIACCVIHKADKIPIRSYKAMKTAVQYQN